MKSFFSRVSLQNISLTKMMVLGCASALLIGGGQYAWANTGSQWWSGNEAVATASWAVGGGTNTLVKEIQVRGDTTSSGSNSWSGSESEVTPSKGTLEDLLAYVNYAAQIGAVILAPLIFLTNWLLSPSWMMGDIFGLRPIFHDLWIAVSNIVYVIFALILLAAAFMNIFSVGGVNEKYKLKMMLPRFIVGILIVPFTWFVVQFVISASSIMTASVMQIPQEIAQKHIPLDEYFQKVTIPKEMTLNLFSSAKTADLSSSTGTITLKDFLSQGNQVFSPLYYFGYGIFKIQNLQQKDPAFIKTLANLSLSVLFGLIFNLAFFVVMLILFFALALRIVYLWVYAIVSPVFGLMYFFGKDGSPEFAKKLSEHLNFKEFISLALVPVYTAAALSFGMIVTSSVAGRITNEQDNKTQSEGIIKDPMSNYAISWDTISVGWVNITIKTDQAAKNIGNQAVKIGNYGARGVGNIILMMLAIILLWLAVIAALSASKVTKMIAEPLAGLMKTAVTKTPIPLLPGGVSLSGMKELAHFPEKMIEHSHEQRMSLMRSKVFGKKEADVKDILGMKELIAKSSWTQDEATRAQMHLQNIGRSLGTGSQEFREYFGKFKEKAQGINGWSKIAQLNDKALLTPDGLTEAGAALVTNKYGISDVTGKEARDYMTENSGIKKMDQEAPKNTSKIPTTISKFESFSKTNWVTKEGAIANHTLYARVAGEEIIVDGISNLNIDTLSDAQLRELGRIFEKLNDAEQGEFVSKFKFTWKGSVAEKDTAWNVIQWEKGATQLKTVEGHEFLRARIGGAQKNTNTSK